MRVSSELRHVLAGLHPELEAHAALLAPYATVEIALVPDPDGLDDSERVGASRIGGMPDLPPELTWPARRWPLAEVGTWPPQATAGVEAARALGTAWTDGDELVMPLAFIAQVDLATIAELSGKLPPRGVLSLFASITSHIEGDDDLASRVAVAVHHFAEPDALVPREPPPTEDRPPPKTIALHAVRAIRWNIPHDQRPALEAALSPAARDALKTDESAIRHALLPAPGTEAVGPMPPVGHTALMRIVDDDDSEFRVGDASWLTIVVPTADFAAHRFERARASVFIG